MLRMSLITRFFSNSAPVYKGYTIRKLAYLIEAPPTQPANGYIRFASQQTSGKQELDIAKNSTVLAEKWKKSPEIHQKFNKQYEADKQKFKSIKKAYEDKFSVPFKRVTSTTLFVSNLYKENKIKVQSKDIRQYAKAVTQQIKKMTVQEKEKLTEEANKINSKRRKIQEKMKFPVRQYFTQEEYSRTHRVSKTEGIREKRRQQREQYQEYLEKWEGKVAEWLEQNNYDISIQDFTQLYNKTYRQAKKAKEEKEVQDEDD